ncbi:MAG: molecular chaperone DnaJ [Candidatus Eisenbacteria bacterium]
MHKRDYYEVLGVDRSATDDDIKRAYRQLALKYHPDRNPDDKTAEDKFKEATAAYEVLKEADARSRYDRFGHRGMDGIGFDFDMGGFDLSDALNIFSQAFGGSSFGGIFDMGRGGRGGSAGKGRDLKIKVTLGLEDVARETKKKIRFSRLASCKSCSGTGAKKGTALDTCPTCGGTGQIRRVQRSFLGQLVNVMTCNHCRGEGRVVTEKCDKCRGEGRYSIEETLEVKIPAGVSSSNYIPIDGKGDDGVRGGPSGRLLVYFEEKEHPIFDRDGADIYCDVPIDYSLAALGGSIDVPTLDGPHTLKIPVGTQSQKVFALKGKGLPRISSKGRGRQLVRVIVWVPTRMSKDERKILEELGNLPKSEKHEAGKGFLKKLRKHLGD